MRVHELLEQLSELEEGYDRDAEVVLHTPFMQLLPNIKYEVELDLVKDDKGVIQVQILPTRRV